ncbi:MAG: GIY-YIG nuclease family protein [Myxococcota bacterium]|nr:GIY-YIG nuclease family protein [Myxococcota bacterium]
MNWCLYVLECKDGSYYCGITNGITRRLEQHNAGSGAKYTRSRRPVTLKHHWPGLSHSEAAKAEYRFKRLCRRQKEQAILDSSWPSSVLKERHSADASSPDSAE